MCPNTVSDLPMINLRGEYRALKKRRSLSDNRRTVALAAIMRTRTIFVHVPKCGGKSVIRDLYDLDVHEWFGHAGIQFYSALLGPSRFGSFKKFAVLRDPVQRCRSAFFFAKQGGFDLETDQEIEAQLRDLDFDAFVRDGMLSDMIEKYVIFRTQWRFVCAPEGHLMVDKICRLETLAAELPEFLGDQFDQKNISHINTSEYRRDKPVDPATEAKIQQLYQRDFDLLKIGR